MPATSQAQQHLFGMALAVKRGEKKLSDLPEGVREEVRRILRLKEAKLREYASTSTKGLPRHAMGHSKMRRARS